MSNFVRAAYHPEEKVIRAAYFLDDYFGQHRYGVGFEGDPMVYPIRDCEIPLDKVFVEKSGAS